MADSVIQIGKCLHPARRAGRAEAFTLIELLVVVAIIVVLISVLLPSLSTAREQAKTVSCLSNLRGIGASLAVYADENGCYPVIQTGGSNTWWTVQVGKMMGRIPTSSALNAAQQYNLLDDYKPMQCPVQSEKYIRLLNNHSSSYAMSKYMGTTDMTASVTYKVKVKPALILDPGNKLLVSEAGYGSSGTTYVVNLSLNGSTLWTSSTPGPGLTSTGGVHHGTGSVDSNNILWADGHAATWKDVRPLCYSQPHRPGGTDDYWKPWPEMPD